MTLQLSPRHIFSLVAAGALCATALTVAGAGTAEAATGDTRTVAVPTLPSTCTTLTSTLATPSSRTFSSAQESAAPDTARIQAALTSCAGTGKAVVLAASGSDTAFLSAPLTIGSGVYLVLDTGVHLFASRKASDYQISGKATCGTVTTSSTGCNPFISITGSNSGIEGTQSSSGAQGTIDGRGDLDIYGTSTTWWQQADTAQADGKDQVNPRLVQATGVSNTTVYDVNMVDAAKQHLFFSQDDGITVYGLRIKTVDTARNTDAIDIDSSTNATVEYSYLMAGDDCLAVTTNKAAAAYITFQYNHCYGTHGISIGSDTSYGVNSVLVYHNYIQGTDSNGTVSGVPAGLRIKSYSAVGGTVQNIHYYTTCMTGLKYPLDFDPFYSSSTGTAYPYYKSVVVYKATELSSLSGAKSVLEGYSASYPLGLTLEDVSFDSNSYTAQYATVAEYDTTLTPSGTGVTTSTFTGSGSAPSCTFPAFPAL
ncbi:glycoside hydrolase family 28 protein [Streptacidiphilus carbonis]|uniref:glycoside hydrolase family 28 protein n=1 Tax=Streptacidiphilus carbonis TaxID=105422 RepID=UPI0005A6F43B|nr:glycosyl hydrolase family 28 protein [Streptacidiphilus carbonis]